LLANYACNEPETATFVAGKLNRNLKTVLELAFQWIFLGLQELNAFVCATVLENCIFLIYLLC